jgi:ectoine hydroxylase-related dioxygenase (phytanoyl-CoA dioxygenase family)
MQMNASANDSVQLAKRLETDGYVVIENALSPGRLETLNASVDRYLDAYPEAWIQMNDHTVEIENVLPSTDEFDGVVEDRHVLDILRHVIGENITFEQFSFMVRNPSPEASAFRGWHRDLTRDYSRRKEIDAISSIYFLTDVTEDDTCFTIIPESHNRLIDLDPADVGPDEGVDIVVPAGTALVFHVGCIHAGKTRPKSRQRKTLHVYYSRSGVPRTAEWSEIPERLYAKTDPALPATLYAKWNETNVFEGVGKIPEGIDRSLPIPEIVKAALIKGKQEE